MRFIHAAREVNAEHGVGLRSLAFYTDPDRSAMFVREADESFGLGPATFLDGADRKSTYSSLPVTSGGSSSASVSAAG